MQTYAASAVKDPDVALQLPTGSGKTLVGLLVAEWRRRKNHERVLYLCTTNQLVNQVVEQAQDKYGLTVLAFTGSAKNYEPSAKAEYRNADRIAVTNYSSLFNTKPFFTDADVLIVDDVHAGESYISQLWSVRIERTKPEHSAVHGALRNILKPLLDYPSFARLCGDPDSLPGTWVDKLPTPDFASVQAEVSAVLDVHLDGTALWHGWSTIREHLHACQLYFSAQEILVRPLIPPTWTHAPFTDPKQRVYMSATLGAGGDLERLVGRQPIERLQVPEGWNKQGVGRRFFIFPSMSLKDEEVVELRRNLMRRAGRSLVLVPSDRLRDEIAKDVGENLEFATFSADDIEFSKKPFISEDQAVAIVANRYDGIDFPGDECRLLFIEGLPRAMNLQERFLMSRMGANVLFNERIQTRVLQAIGRCTRSLEDYSAVVVSGDELPEYLADIARRKFLHPELQAELSFGVDQSKRTSQKDLIDNFEIFLENGEEWEEVNQLIVSTRKECAQVSFPALTDLSAVVEHEIEFESRLWQGDYEAALAAAESVLAGLDEPELRGYRALWHYLAGSAAWLCAQAGTAGLDAKARAHFDHAKRAASGVAWLVRLARFQAKKSAEDQDRDILMEQIERFEAVLSRLGTIHDRAFARRERDILQGLAAEDDFEQAHKLLGEVLGFDAGKIEAEGSPDPWWIAGGLCLVFEDHVGAEEDSILDVNKARQVSSHPAWMRENVERCAKAEILPVLVTPITKAKSSAIPHLQGVALWRLEDMREWANNALATVRELRKTFFEPGNLIWRAQAAELFEQNGLAAPKLFKQLQSQLASEALKGASQARG